MAAPRDPDETVVVRAQPVLRRPFGAGVIIATALVVGLAGGGAAMWWYLGPPGPARTAAPSGADLTGTSTPSSVGSLTTAQGLRASGGRVSAENLAGGTVTAAVVPTGAVRMLDAPRSESPRAPATPSIAIRSADEATILADEPAALTVFRFTLNPAVLVLDFPTLAQQGRMLNRVAVFVEKAGMPHDRLLDDTALDAAIRAGGDVPETLYYGHDYSAGDLRRFFALATRDHIALTADEAWLRLLMVQQGWLSDAADGSGSATQTAPAGAIISLPRVGSDPMVDVPARAVILHHELSHGEYFTNPDYAAYAAHFWTAAMSPQDRTLFRAFLGRDHYDTAIEDLMVNETQAYLMHTSDPRFFSAAAVRLSQARLDLLRAAFLLNMPHGWLRDCTVGPDPRPGTRVPRRVGGRAYGVISSRKAVAATRAPRRRAASIAL